MSLCKVCNKEIKRGARFKSERYKNFSFCSEQCYNIFLKVKEKKEDVKNNSLNRLKKYIEEIWEDKINWPFIMKQVKTMCEEYQLNYKELYLVIKYGVEIEQYTINTQFGLMQFIKFIEPCMQFVEQINRAKELAEDMEDEEVVVRKVSKQVKKIKEEEWD